MEKNTTYEIELRQSYGTGSSRALRREGNCPANIYGGSDKPLSVAIERRKVVKALERGGYFTSVCELHSKDGKIKERVLPREVQFHPVTDQVLHIDFQRVTSKTQITVEVPIVVVGHEESPGLRVGGVLNIVRHTVELLCRADSIPDSIEVNVAGAEVGDSVHIESVKLPEGTQTTVQRNFTLVTVAGVKQEEEEPTVAEEGAEEGAEAAEGAEEGAEAEKTEEDK